VAELKLIKDDYNCNLYNECISSIIGSSKYCADRTCTKYINQPILYVKQNYFIKIFSNISTSFPSAYIDEPTLFIFSDNLTREIPVISTEVLKNESAIII